MALQDPLSLMVPDDLGLGVGHLALERGRHGLGDRDILQLPEELVLHVDSQLAFGLVVSGGALVLAGSGHGAVLDSQGPGRTYINI
jgi:hypothetical protein